MQPMRIHKRWGGGGGFLKEHDSTCSQLIKPKSKAIGSHMRLMEPSEPPWLLNQSVKLTLSRALTSRMPPSGSTRALTMGDVPNAKEFAAYISTEYEHNMSSDVVHCL